MNSDLTREQLLQEMHELSKQWLETADHFKKNKATAHAFRCCAADLAMLREAWLILIVKEKTLPPAR